jgi:hypothetical protein
MQLDMSAKSNGAKRKKTRTSACTDVAPYNLYTRFIRWPLPVRKRRVARAFLGAVERNRRARRTPLYPAKTQKAIEPVLSSGPAQEPRRRGSRAHAAGGCGPPVPDKSRQHHFKFILPSRQSPQQILPTPRPGRCDAISKVRVSESLERVVTVRVTESRAAVCR